MSDHEDHPACDLTPADQRAVERAVELHESEGALRCNVDADLVIGTAVHRFLLRRGTCVAASIDLLEGAALVGWLLRSARASSVGAWWRRGARAVFLLRRGERRVFVVSDESTILHAGGAPVEDGFATQTPRFVACHSDRPSAATNAWALPDLFDALDDEAATLPGYRYEEAGILRAPCPSLP
jgi:hypothetical protein